MKPIAPPIALATALAISALLAWAGDDPPAGATIAPATQAGDLAFRDPYFLGWETEPAMEFGGRTLASLDAGACRLMRAAFRVDRHPFFAAFWEMPFGLLTMVAQHEVNGHGARAREYDLDPSYGAQWNLSFYTNVAKEPATNEQNVLLGAGGTEASAVLGRRLVLDLYRPEGGEASSVPLALFAKLDLPLYVLVTHEPEAGDGTYGDPDFTKQYRDGYDTAYYLVSRQARRTGADPAVVWDGDYEVDFTDPLLRKNWRAMRTTALWSLLDPALGFSVYSYARQHVGAGRMRVRPPVLRLAEGYGLTATVRGILGAAEVSRVLEVIATTPRAVATAYVRDLDSSLDRTWGWGLGLHGFRIAPGLEIGASLDRWREPDAAEAPSAGSCWNASASADLLVRRRWGFSAKVGHKTAGFYPGTPTVSGGYLGFAVRAAF